MASEQELSDFLKSVERRAFKRVVYAVRDDDAALDVVQESMIRLAESYSDRPASEFPMLFQRILSNATADWFRRQKVKSGLFRNFSDFDTGQDDSHFDILEAIEILTQSSSEAADARLSRAQILLAIETEIQTLPERQREAFLLRYWEELDVSETALAMGCSEGSVKTHCSRAVRALAIALRLRGIEP